ncbi:MAG: hypothetical protein U1E25_12320 [Methylocystis sp.]
MRRWFDCVGSPQATPNECDRTFAGNWGVRPGGRSSRSDGERRLQHNMSPEAVMPLPAGGFTQRRLSAGIYGFLNRRRF